MNERWDRHFMQLAAQVASMSKDPSTKCGAVIVRPDKSIASTGFNGFPKGCDDDPAFYEDRAVKYERVIHAELNAILLAGTSVRGCAIYVWPPGPGTCARCAAHIIQAGITRVVMAETNDEFAERWRESAALGLQMYAEAGVIVDCIAAD